MGLLEELLTRSIEEYRTLLDVGSELAFALEKGRPQAVRDLCGRYSKLQEVAQETDRELDPHFEAGGGEVAKWPLFRERMELMADVLERTRAVAERGAGMLSALGAERNQIRGARAAMSGYTVGSDRRGRILNGPC